MQAGVDVEGFEGQAVKNEAEAGGKREAEETPGNRGNRRLGIVKLVDMNPLPNGLARA